ncbi:hypothetical protein [Mesorhizobium sp.]|nr:hypothetical protein [Mesorhizobium sp.]
MKVLLVLQGVARISRWNGGMARPRWTSGMRLRGHGVIDAQSP